MKKIISMFLAIMTLLVGCNISVIANAEKDDPEESYTIEESISYPDSIESDLGDLSEETNNDDTESINLYSVEGITVTIATTDNKAVTVGNTLKATVSGASGNIEYQWYADDALIDGATEETFVPTYNQHKKAVKCVATVGGAEVSSEAVTVTSKFKETLNYANFAWKEVGANGTADLTGDKSWEFSMINEAGTTLSFSLLDTFNNSDAKYYIMANDLYESYATPGTIAKYDPTEEGSMAYHVNTAFTQETVWTWSLPKAIIESLDYDHVWVTEKANGGSAIKSPYTYTAAVTVPAVWEMDTYKARIRFKVGGGNYNYLFRTPLNDTNYHVYNASQEVTRTADGEYTIGIVHGNDGKWWYRLAPQGLGEATIRIRPEFFINEDFFKIAKIDLATAGEGIRQEIAELGIEALKELYTPKEMITYLGFNQSDFDNMEDDDSEIDGEYFSEERTVNYMPWNNEASVNASATAKEAAKYKFSLASNGDTFSLLDVKNDSKSKYFVITDAPYASKVFVKNENPNYFATEDGAVEVANNDRRAEQYPSWALNGQYFEKGWTFNKYNGAVKKIDSAVRTYIDFNHVWTGEAAPKNSVPNEQYTTTAGIMYPSASEVAAYGDRFLVNTDAEFVTRTMANTGSGTDNRYIGKVTPSGGKYIAVATQVQLNVRPCFWLNDQFFSNVKIDLATAGAAVKQEIAKVEYKTLKNLYTEEELEIYLDITEADSNDYVIKNVEVKRTGEGKASVSGTVKSNIQDETNAVVIVAIYDSEDIMVGSAATNIQLDRKGDTESFDLTVGELSDDEYTVKIMFWDNLYDANAIINQYEVDSL